jgi:glycosyltransferase involved in cell wall biosynthesis
MLLLGPLALPFRLLRLRAWMKHQQVSLMIGMTTIPAIKVLLAATALGVPCVVSERNYPPLKHLGLPWRVLRRLTYSWADLHLVQTEVVGRWLSRHVAAEPQLLLPNPVIWPLPDGEPHLDPQEWLEQADVYANDPVLMAVGTKAQQKGFDRLVDWFRELAPRHPRLQLVIVGLASGSYHGRDQQQDLRRQLLSHPSLQKRLHFPGPVGNLQQWYERAQVFVLSSRYEGFPNVLLEAMASGCCCIAADCPQGPAELIKDGVNGRLIPEESSPQIWVDVIEGLLLKPINRQRFGTSARDVRERYDPAQLARSFVDAIEILRR